MINEDEILEDLKDVPKILLSDCSLLLQEFVTCCLRSESGMYFFEVEGACPPEDCGGVVGYLDLLEIIEDPTHEEYESLMEWLEESQYDPSFDLEETNWWMKETLKLKRPKK